MPGGSLGSRDLNSGSGGRFQQCLRSQRDSISDIMGMAFFNVLEIPCFVLKEQEACVEWHWWGGYVEHGTGGAGTCGVHWWGGCMWHGTDGVGACGVALAGGCMWCSTGRVGACGVALAGRVHDCPLESLHSQQGKLGSKTREGRRSVCPLETMHCRVCPFLWAGSGVWTLLGFIP